MTDIQDDLTLAVLMAEVRAPDSDHSFSFGTRRLEWTADRQSWARKRVIVQFNTGWVIADDGPFRAITFPDLVALFQNAEYRERWGLNPP